MKNLIFLTFLWVSATMVYGQSQNSWLIDNRELLYTVPVDWEKDIYYGLRECDCSGLLLDNSEYEKDKQVYLAIHPTSKKIKTFIEYSLNNKVSTGEVKIGKRKYEVFETEVQEKDNILYVKQFISKSKKRNNNLNILFGAYDTETLLKNESQVLSIIESLSFKKVDIPLKKKWWFVDDDALTYQVPNSWAVDPFMTSSVCHCWGTIMDNREWEDDYVGIVIYPSSQEAQKLPNRNEVWDYEFVPNGVTKNVSFAGINYLLEEGNMVDHDKNEVAWKLTSLNRFKEDQAFLTIHFWTQKQNNFDKNIATFEEILSTIQLKNLKYDFE